jgi:uncharacterized membrane protein YvbJ
MAVCPQCGAAVAEDAVVCDACNALIASNNSIPTSDERRTQLNLRFEKALRRSELLSYAAAGLGLAIFVVIIVISFLWFGGEMLTDEELEKTIKRIERLNRFLSVAVLAEIIVLVLFI